MHLQIATRQVADATIATPAGRIDHRSAAEFEAALTPLIAAAAMTRKSGVSSGDGGAGPCFSRISPTLAPYGFANAASQAMRASGCSSGRLRRITRRREPLGAGVTPDIQMLFVISSA